MIFIFTKSSVDGTIHTEVIPENEFHDDYAKFIKESTYYVVDPDKTKDSRDLSSTFIGKV
jgi:hypothetical protein